jgi:hypothetical protein
MGKDYSTSTYKKSYGTEYVKTYKNYRTDKALYEEQRKAYETISKKLDSKPYQQSEKKVYDKNASTQKQVKKNPPQSQQPPKYIEKKSSEYTITEVPPPYDAQSEFRQSDYSKIDINALKHPIVLIRGGMYRNIYTDETVNEEEARRILEYVGYKPKPMANLGLFFFFLLIVAFLIKAAGPIGLIIWGWITKSKSMTDYVKIIGTNALVFQMPASDIEKLAYRNRGNTYIIAGIIIGVLQLLSLFY